MRIRECGDTASGANVPEGAKGGRDPTCAVLQKLERFQRLW